MNTLRTALTGEYTPIGDVKDADCVVGQSFGTGFVNEQIAQYVLENRLDQLPLILQQEIADGIFDLGSFADHVITGDPSTSIGTQLDSWQVLSRAKAYMEQHDLEHPILVGQAHQMGRLTLQAIKLGLDPIVPEGLPVTFDPASSQFWTRNRGAWVLRETIGIPYLRATSKL